LSKIKKGLAVQNVTLPYSIRNKIILNRLREEATLFILWLRCFIYVAAWQHSLAIKQLNCLTFTYLGCF